MYDYHRANKSERKGEFTIQQEDLRKIEEILSREFTTDYKEKKPGK